MKLEYTTSTALLTGKPQTYSAEQVIERARAGMYKAKVLGYVLDETIALALASLLEQALAHIAKLEAERGIVKEWEDAQLDVLELAERFAVAHCSAYIPAVEQARLTVALVDATHKLASDTYGKKMRAVGLEAPPPHTLDPRTVDVVAQRNEELAQTATNVVRTIRGESAAPPGWYAKPNEGEVKP